MGARKVYFYLAGLRRENAIKAWLRDEAVSISQIYSSLPGQDRHARKERSGYGSWIHVGNPGCQGHLQDEDQGEQGHESTPPNVLPWSLWAERIHDFDRCR